MGSFGKRSSFWRRTVFALPVGFGSTFLGFESTFGGFVGKQIRGVCNRAELGILTRKVSCLTVSKGFVKIFELIWE
jgi:hypothetical protein